MKILAFRGENLASLPSFDVDLVAPPLGETNIFAITGPTGAGKSTLLDALCLALYDRVPRLLGQRQAAAEDERAGDPRAVMRRGSAEAFAEVDFLGVDGEPYRARWEAWRSRRKPDGRLQDQRLSLDRLAPDGPVSLTEARRTDTARRIAERVGLGFDEFRRAVLLAQGDFAAFLRASPDARAGLLERMTGSGLYARLSVAAFERAKREAAEREALEARAAAVPVWSEERRATVEAQSEDLAGQLTAKTRDLEVATKARAWHHTEAALRTERDDARRAWEEAEAKTQSSLPKLDSRIRRADMLRALVPFVKERDAAVAQELAAKRELEAAEAEKGAAHAGAEVARETLERSEAAWLEASQAEEAARGPLEHARRLDRLIKDAEAPLRGLKEDLQRAEDAVRAAKTADAAQAQAIRAEEEAEAENAAWWAERPFLEGALEPPALEADLQAVARHRAAEALAEAEHGAALGAERAAARESQACIAARDEAQLAFAKAERARGAAESGLRRIRDREAGDEDAAARVALEPLATALRRARVEIEDHGRRRRHRRQLAVQAERARTRARAREAELEAAQRAEARAEEAVLIRARQALVPGAPCPVCGSVEHPRGAEIPPSPDAAPEGAPARARVDTARAELLELRQQQAEREGQMAQLDAAMEESETRWRELRERLVGVWIEAPRLHRAGLTKAGLLLPETLPSERSGLTPALTQLEAVESALEAGAVELEHAEATFREAERRALEAQAEASRRSGAAQLAEAEEARQRDGRLRWERSRDAERGARQALERGLHARLEGWPGGAERLAAAPDQLAQEAAELLEAARDRGQRETVRAARLESLRASRPGAGARIEEAEATRTRAVRAHRELTERLASAREERAQIWHGRAADEVEAELRKRRLEAQATRETARRERVEADARNVAAQGEHRARRARFEVSAQTRAARATALRAALDALPDEDRAGAEEAAGAGPEDPSRLRAERDRLITTRAEAESRRDDRRQRWEAHARSRPDLDAEAAERAERELGAEVSSLRETEARTRAGLEADDAARAQRSALDPELLARATSTATWAELSAVIGSADGKKLRSFAQSLTLEALVEQANFHLAVLRPRYLLRRVPRVDMELEIVDLDMGEERRSLGSLSGGETFLVSLALALGLSDLSARSVPIESLFIDEGFGALDGESLDTALSALDQLQASGRTVGLVSHVGEVAERIGYEVQVRPVSPGRAEVSVKAP